jgi:hypothetical protein
MKHDPQRFVTSLRNPFVLIKTQGDKSPGRRPASRVAWLEHDCGDYYLGGVIVSPTKMLDIRAVWHFRYNHQMKIRKEIVLHVFNYGTGEKIDGHLFARQGISRRMVNMAKAALPLIPEDPPAAPAVPLGVPAGNLP